MARPQPRLARKGRPLAGVAAHSAALAKGQVAGWRAQVAVASGQPARGGCPRCAYKGAAASDQPARGCRQRPARKGLPPAQGQRCRGRQGEG
ncbi:hypothetical protein BHM03_00052416 [Ensete ventricosum]|nr:hypothetical protein BHM03_00052416 [Ensete ventricosum]